MVVLDHIPMDPEVTIIKYEPSSLQRVKVEHSRGLFHNEIS
jgi:hypothetical protein